MPHLVLEYSKNLPLESAIDALLTAIHQAMVTSEVAPLADIKSRALMHDHFRIADGASELSFVHLQVRLLSGRDTSVRARLTQQLMGVLTEHVQRIAPEGNCQLSVEIREMERHSYLKERLEPVLR